MKRNRLVAISSFLLLALAGLAITVVAQQTTSIADDGDAVKISVNKYDQKIQTGWDTHTGDCNGDTCQTYNVPIYADQEMLNITARDTSVKIIDVTVNRGACKVSDSGLPKLLKFGEFAVFSLPCNPIEVSVKTDQGTATFSWDN